MAGVTVSVRSSEMEAAEMTTPLMKSHIIKSIYKSSWEQLKFLLQYILYMTGSKQAGKCFTDEKDLKANGNNEEAIVISEGETGEVNFDHGNATEPPSDSNVNKKEDNSESIDVILKPPTGLKKLGLRSDMDEFTEDDLQVKSERPLQVSIQVEDRIEKQKFYNPTLSGSGGDSGVSGVSEKFKNLPTSRPPQGEITTLLMIVQYSWFSLTLALSIVGFSLVVIFHGLNEVKEGP